MKNYVITNGFIYLDNHEFSKGNLYIIEGKIGKISHNLDESIDDSFEVIDASGKMVLPGFIDIHVNGGGNHLVIEGTDEAIKSMAYAHGKMGTTSLVPTTISCSITDLKKTLTIISKYVGKKTGGAHILGSNLEGPFLNPTKAGAHRKEFLFPVSFELFDSLYLASHETLKIISIAPELENGIEFVSYAKSKGIIVGLAHSDADYDTTLSAIKSGMSLCSHVFNGMQGMTHRSPGPIPAFLNNSLSYVELIGDGKHVNSAVAECTIRAKANKRVILVTDAVSPAGTNTKEFSILGTPMSVKDHSCYTTEGLLGGSALTLSHAIKVLKDTTSIPMTELIPLATEKPAELLGIDDIKGSISIGKDADIIITDSDINVSSVFVGGELLK